ncbi:unnamed protein product [Microthlaspi erraticum]|uniref:CCHC-type domain-containing protein n=1 Tax=Microthlaspi erraticum TaxID=1685480 RepID=A0A6D2IX97_9BRAS|nr:unnamed protein product [Microthlaspi erraticum]
MRFMDIEQGSRTVREYDEEFSRLLVHAGFGMEAEHQLTNRFLEGLRKDIGLYAGVVCTLRGRVCLGVSISSRDSSSSSSAEVVRVSVLVLAGAVCLRRVRRGVERSFLVLVSFLVVPVLGVGARSIVFRVVPRESAPRVCYYCKEPGHIKPMCPKLRSMSVASVQPVAAQPVSQIAAVQPLGQIAPAPRGYSSVETGGTSQTGQITGKSSTQTL